MLIASTCSALAGISTPVGLLQAGVPGEGGGDHQEAQRHRQQRERQTRPNAGLGQPGRAHRRGPQHRAGAARTARPAAPRRARARPAIRMPQTVPKRVSSTSLDDLAVERGPERDAGGRGALQHDARRCRSAPRRRTASSSTVRRSGRKALRGLAPLAAPACDERERGSQIAIRKKIVPTATAIARVLRRRARRRTRPAVTSPTLPCCESSSETVAPVGGRLAVGEHQATGHRVAVGGDHAVGGGVAALPETRLQLRAPAPAPCRRDGRPRRSRRARPCGRTRGSRRSCPRPAR